MTIKALRKTKGYTAERLARELGLKMQTYYAKERGIRKFTAEEMQTICVFLGISIADIKFPKS